MKYGYTNLIAENVAPKGATQVIVKDSSDNEVGKIPLGRIAPPSSNSEEPIIFAVVSDCHTYLTLAGAQGNWKGNTKLDNALTFFEQMGCKFVIGCGDFTQIGFYRKNEGSTNITLDDGRVMTPGTVWYDEANMTVYSNILTKHTIPVFELFGNHENMYKAITLDLDRAKELTGIPYTSYTVSSSADSDEIVGTTTRPNRYAPVGDILFIMCGQSTSSAVMSGSDFAWLGATLESNKDKRCIVCIHPYIEEDSGDPHDVRENSVFETWDKKTEFMELLAGYPNVLLVHGHSHMKLNNQKYYDPTQTLDSVQESYKSANYTKRNGFMSLHVPSLGQPRDINFDENKSENKEGESQCYIAEAYSDCLYIRGYSLAGTTGTPVPLGTYRIEV